MSSVPETKELATRSPSIEGLIARAIDKGTDVATMEKLLAMAQTVKAENARDAYFRALAEFQAECPTIPKTKKVDAVSKRGAHIKYNYAPLDVIVGVVRELLQKHGFSYRIETEQTKDEVAAICVAHHIDGHSERTRFAVPVDPEAYMNAAQKVASALTYAKRYAFCDAFGILTADEDDDSGATDNSEDSEAATVPTCPECGKSKGVIKSKYPENGEWYCHTCKKAFDVEVVEEDQDPTGGSGNSTSKTDRPPIQKYLDGGRDYIEQLKKRGAIDEDRADGYHTDLNLAETNNDWGGARETFLTLKAKYKEAAAVSEKFDEVIHREVSNMQKEIF